jgi:radical SAM protein with 4Fe4S-binding SPASM domain
LSYWCQYRCKTCNIWQRRPADELTTTEVLRFIEHNRHFSWADLTGGEIFLRDDIDEIFDAVASTWRELVILHFPTNGYLTAKIVSAAERLAHRGIPHVIITVSLDGDAQLNDEVRGIKGGFDRQMATFAALHQTDGIQAVLGMTLSRYNAGQVERTFDACQRRYPRLTWNDFHLNLAQVSEHYYGNGGSESILAPRETALRDIALYRSRRAAGASLSGWIERSYLSRLERFLETGVTPMRCHALRSSCFVDPWGTVFPCISYTRPLGRLRETDMRLDPIWRDTVTQAVQQEIWQGDCPQCWTACEAYQSILGNLVRPFDRGPGPSRNLPLAPAQPLATDPTRHP